MRCARRHSSRALALAWAALTVGMPRIAHAQADDSSPPSITPVIASEVRSGQVIVRARILDESGVFEPRLYWRAVGASAWEKARLEPTGAASAYAATLEVSQDFEFWMDAYDEAGNGPARAYSADAPRRVVVVGAAPRVSADRLETAGTSPEEPPSAPVAAPPDLPAPRVDPPPPAPVLAPVRIPARRAEDPSRLAFDGVTDRPGPSRRGESPRTSLPPPAPEPPPPARLEAPVRRFLPPDLRPPPPPPPPVPPAVPLARLLRVSAAGPLVLERLELLLDGGYLGGDDFLLPDARVRGGFGSARLSYVLHPLVEFSGAFTFRAAQVAVPLVDPLWVGSLGDLTLGARVVLPELAGMLRLAAELTGDLPTLLFRDPSPTISPGLLLAATLRQRVFRLHANLGYRWDNSENAVGGQWGAATAFGLNLSRFDAWRIATGFEMIIGSVYPFVEYSLEVPFDRRAFASCESAEPCVPAPPAFPASGAELPQRAGAGLRIEVGGDFALVLGAELSLTGAGRAFSDASRRAVPAPEAFAVPAPISVRAQLVWQSGGTLERDDPPSGLFAPRLPDDPSEEPSPAGEPTDVTFESDLLPPVPVDAPESLP